MLIDLLSDDMKLHEYFSIEGAKTPYALAKFLGITPANVYDWLKNGRPIPINVNFQQFPTLDAKKLVNAPKMSAHHRGICHF